MLDALAQIRYGKGKYGSCEQKNKGVERFLSTVGEEHTGDHL